MELIFLGTGSAYPSPNRGASSMVLRQESGDCWMFDCGEGTQVQLMKSKVRPGKINKIFITHLHGDHLFGLPGLLCTLSQNSARTEPLDIYGPYGLRKFLRTSLALSRSQLIYSYRVHEILPSADCSNDIQTEWYVDHESSSVKHPAEWEGGQNLECDEHGIWNLYDDGTLNVTSSRLDHSIPSYGFVIQEADLIGSLNVAKLKELGVKPGPEYGRLKAGQCIVSPSGQTIHPDHVIGPSQPGRKVVILGDTRDSSAMTSLCTDCDVMVHEATLENAKREDAIEKGHSTPEMAASFAKLVGAKSLILTHFSQRYKTEAEEDYDTSVKKLVDEAEVVFPGPVVAASDLMSVQIPRQKTR